jgi:hypothetical protein
MGSFQSLIPGDVMDRVIEIVLSEFYVEMRAMHKRITNSCLIREEWQKGPIWQWNPDQMEKEIARNAAMEEGADLSVRAMVETENRREMLKIVAHLFDEQRSLTVGATWEKFEIGGSDQISVQLVAKYYGPEREITLKREELEFYECETESIHWRTMREIGFEVQKALDERKKRDEEREWWKVGEESVDVTELIRRWKNRERDLFFVHVHHKPASWETIWKLQGLNDANREKTIEIVFKHWTARNPSRTRGAPRTVEDRILVDITTNVWWVVDFRTK